MHSLIIRHHRMILALAGLLTLTALLLCLRLRLDLNFLSLLPPNNAQTKTFFEVTEKVGLQSILISSVTMPGRMTEEAREAFIELLGRQYARNPMIEEVDYRRGQFDLTRIYPMLLRYLPNLLRPDDADRLRGMLSDEAIQNKVASNKKLLMTPFGFAAKEWVLMDPLGLGALLQSGFSIPTKSLIHKGHNGFYSTGDGTYLIFLKPVRPPQDIAFSRRLMVEIASLEKNAIQEAQQKFEALTDDPVIAHTGGYPIAVNDEATTKQDIKVSLVTSIVGVLTLFAVCFRTTRILGHVALPLGMSLVWSLGLAALLFGRLNLLTCLFSCVLAGLGIDFAIHFINRFYSAEKTAGSLDERLAATFRETSSGIIIGGVTTAAAFMSIGISDFRGFRELGIMTGAGILLCLAAMLSVLPALLVRSYHREKGRSVQIAGFGLTPLMRMLGRRPVPVLAAVALAAVLLIVEGTAVRFDDNLKHFRGQDNQVLRLQDQITQWLGGSSASTLLVLGAPSEAAAMERGTRMWQALKELSSQGDVADVMALQAFFPSPTQQRASLKAFEPDWPRIRATFSEALRANGLKRLEAYDRYFDTLTAAFASREVLLPSKLADSELGPLLKMFAYAGQGQYKSVIYVRPTADLWSRQDAERFKTTLENHLASRGIDAGSYTLTGTHLLSSALKTVILENLRTALVLAVAVIVVTLLVFYRRVLPLLGALSPLAVALAMLAGIMTLLKIDFNFINVVVLPMIVGIGIDDGVHLTNTYINHGERFIPHALARTGRGVVLTSLTTMVGFGSISLSHYPGLKSMGYVAVIGVGTCLATSVLLLPPLLAILGRRNRTERSLRT